MNEKKKEEKKEPRRPGDPYRVQVCRMDDNEVGYMTRMANLMGKVPYEYKGWLCVDVLGDGLVYRAKDAIFRPVKDGLYTFTKDEKGNVYCQG